VCPGCGIDDDECAQLHAELAAYTLTHGDRNFIHQHVVDAYAAQHACLATKTIGPAFAVIGLYLALEEGFTGRQVQRAHMDLARLKKQWPKLEPPRDYAILTVADVMKADPGEPRDAAIMKWAAAVWNTWHDQHEWIRQLYATA
jgi:hypothetical protein